MNTNDHPLSRRTVLKGMAGATLLPFVGAFAALQARHAQAAGASTALVDSPYGPIAPVDDLSTGLPLLQLPPGFSYKSFGWRGDLMADGQACPGAHDGMGVITARKVGRRTELVLVRNHEVGAAADFIHAPAVYDAGAISTTSSDRFGGGTTNLLFCDGNWTGMRPSLGGTVVNCAGGVTPWGTWLSCEELGSDLVGAAGKKHGYVFEVCADPARTSGLPIIGMGRFAHEAAAVDPATGHVYETEDSSRRCGLYRYVPDACPGRPGSLAMGGVLQMAKVKGADNVNLADTVLHARHELEWVDIADPDHDRGNATGPSGITIDNVSGPFLQGWSKGALRLNRAEGIFYAQGKIYVMDSTGGPISRGALWELDVATQCITCIYASPSELVGNMGDNLTVSPRDGILLCEDGSTGVTDCFGFGQRLMGLTCAGDAYIFAKNNIVLSNAQLNAAGKLPALAGDHRAEEFAGACFDPSGRHLFVNIQIPGITFAITGPWARGPL